MSAHVREWAAAHLPWLMVGLLVLWLPPVAYTIAVDVGLTSGTGYPRLTDPTVILPTVELALVLSAIRPLLRREVIGWRRLAWSRIVVLAQTGWLAAITVRLSGVAAAFSSRPIVEAVVGLAIAVAILACTKPMYGARPRDAARYHA